MQEIERKYLVVGDGYRSAAFASAKIAQGYLCTRRVTARVRRYGNRAFLTVKGKSRDGGLSRFEWEREIPLRCAEHLISRCSGVVEKERYLVRDGEFVWEVDEFSGDNQGLIIAECELQSVEQQPSRPSWVGDEVTGIFLYHNSFLAKHPYREWQNNPPFIKSK